MARLQCKCGETMWNGQAPNDIEVWCCTDRRLDEILANDSILSLELWDSYSYNVWVCPRCKRLYVFDRYDLTKVKCVYTPEKENSNGQDMDGNA